MNENRGLHFNRSLLNKNSRFLRLWIGQLFSQSCIRMYQIALLWWIITRFPTHAGKISGVFLILGALPAICFVKWIGKAVDRYSRKSILVSADLFASLILFSIAALSKFDHLHLAWIFISSFTLALCQAFYDPTLFKALPGLVEKEDREQGVAFLSSTQSIANFTGAILGAILIEKMGITFVALMNGMGYFIALLFNLSIHFEKDSTDHSLLNEHSNLNIKSFFNQFPVIRNLLIGFGAINFFSMPTLVILPLYVKQSLQGSASTLSFLEASLWLGLITGTFLSSRVQLTENPIRVGVYSLTLMGLFLTFPGLFHQVSISILFLFLAGACLGINNTKFMSYFQESVPENIKGSFFAHLQALIGFSTPMAFFLFGSAADLFGPSNLFILEGLGVVIVSLFFYKMTAYPFPRVLKELS